MSQGQQHSNHQLFISAFMSSNGLLFEAVRQVFYLHGKSHQKKKSAHFLGSKKYIILYSEAISALETDGWPEKSSHIIDNSIP